MRWTSREGGGARPRWGQRGFERWRGDFLEACEGLSILAFPDQASLPRSGHGDPSGTRPWGGRATYPIGRAVGVRGVYSPGDAFPHQAPVTRAVTRPGG